MIHEIGNVFWRSAMNLWLTHSQFSYRRLPVAHDSPHVHAPGSNPDRILIAGDGASAGVGVVTHDLGLPGYLARDVSLITKRAADVDIAVTADATIASSLRALQSLELSRFDVILLSLGSNEAMGFVDPITWVHDLTLMLDHIHEHSPSATKTIVLSIPLFGQRSRVPRILRMAVDRRAIRLNQLSADTIRFRANVRYLAFLAGDSLESDGSHTYERWARAIAPTLAEELEPRSGDSLRSEATHEGARQGALDKLGLVDMPPDRELDQIATTAKELFGVPMAGITFIDRDRQSLPAAIGIAPADIARADAFCNITIRRATHFVIEDALLDARYARNPVVANPPHIRFYAGYPIETPDGQRVGALCVMDTVPRAFTPQDASLLRDLAQRAQDRLWLLSGQADVIS